MMGQILKTALDVKAFHMLGALVLLMFHISFAHARTVSYDVMGVFFEPQTQPIDTTFNGRFDWDGVMVLDFHGTMNSSMYPTDNVNPVPRVSFPLMHLDYQFAQSIEGDVVTVTVFKEDTTDVFTGGGYETTVDKAYRYGVFDELPANNNAYFTLAFNKTTMTGILEGMVYADCTLGGMMGPTCMTGHNISPYFGTMGAYPLSLTISEVAPVPVPTAVWLFSSALAGLVSVSRMRDLFV